MNSIPIKNYFIKDNNLGQIVKKIWLIDSEEAYDINHKLLPARSSDIILNLGQPITYNFDGIIEKVNAIHLSVLKTKFCHVKQDGKLFMIGITLKPLGMYPILKTPISEFNNTIIDVDNITTGISNVLYNFAINYKKNEKNCFEELEKNLYQFINFELMADRKIIQIINIFESNSGNINLSDFCQAYGINERWLQRVFNKYIGISPNSFLRLCKFKNLLYTLDTTDFMNFTRLSYDYNYYDQSHLIKEFKSFCGDTPKQFLKDGLWIINLLNGKK